MSIINTHKFKNRKRLITESLPNRQLPPRYSQTSNSGYFNIKERHHPKETTNTDTTNNRPEDQCKPFKSQIVYVDDSMHSFQANRKKEEGKKKQYRYLQIDTSKETINQKLVSKSLSKDKNSSSESLRIHKIKSIITLDAMKEGKSVSKDNAKPAKAHRYDTQQARGANDSSSKQKLMRTIMQNRAIKQRARQKNEQQIEEIRVSFNALKDKISMVDQSVKQKDENGQALACYHSILKRNRKIASSIIFKATERKRKECLLSLWKQLILY